MAQGNLPVKPPVVNRPPDDPPSVLNTAAPVAPTVPSFNPGPQGITPEMLQAQQYALQQFQLLQFQAQAQSVEDAKARLDTQRRQNLEVQRSKIAEEEFRRANCSHRKEDNKTHCVGSRDHRSNTHYTCQGCQQNWHVGPMYTHDDTYNPRNYAFGQQPPKHPGGLIYSPRIPVELIPKPLYIGGPITSIE